MVNLDRPIALDERTTIRKGLSGLRQQGLVPAVIHNHGQPSLHVMGMERGLSDIYQEAGKHHPLQLKVGNQDFLALIKDVHYNPVKRRMQHVVFQAIRQDEKVEAEVPIHIEGDMPAERIGLVILHQLDAVVVEALPKDLPDQFVVDGSKLAELHDKVLVADLITPQGVTILTDAEHPIATVVETKAQISEETETAEGEEGEATEGEGTETVESDGAQEADSPEQEAPRQ